MTLPRGRKAAPRFAPGPILIVDDDPEIRQTLTRILEVRGHRVVSAPDAPAALRLSLAERPSLVLVDYMMPGMDGEAFLHALREAHAERTPPALLITASDVHRLRAEALGAVEGLGKPFRVAELLAAVDRYRARVAHESS